MTEDIQNEPTRRWIVILIAVLAVWGLYHAVGAFLFNYDIRRGIVVLGSMTAFLGCWLALLRYRKKKDRRADELNG